MKSILLIGLLFSVFISPLPGALSPIPVVTVESVHLPKVEIRISNPSKTEECIIWKEWCSWEEQNKWFSLRAAGGKKVWELHPKLRRYSKNHPEPQSIPPGKSLAFKCDFSDDTWELPKGFAPGNWTFDIQAHLRISRDVDAHRLGVFIGHVTSGWYDRNGREVGKAGKPVQDEVHTAIETRNYFPWERLTARLEKWDSGTLPDKQSIGDFFGADFPWENLKCVYEGGNELVVLLPEQTVLRFRFHDDLPGAYRMYSAAKLNRPGKDTFPVLTFEWLPAKETLQKTRARLLSSITLPKKTRRDYLFIRAFDKEGRIDKKAEERLR